MRNAKGQFIKGTSGFSGTHTTEAKLRIGLASKGRKPTEKQLQALELGRVKIWTYEMKKNIGKHGNHAKLENHYKWGGGSSKLERGRFRDQLQKKVFERDNYTCQLCEQHGGKLQVDHIQSWSEYVELRFNIDNCRTLCMSCHYYITFKKPMPKDTKVWGHNFRKGVKTT